jgi:DNA-binding MarR family transcriptional regulator
MSKTTRNFKGVWIPKEIWLSKELTLQEKVFLTEIDSLDNEEGCFAGNSHFAEFFSISTHRASQVINSLIKKGFISAQYIRKGKEIVKRVLRISHEGIKKMSRTPLENVKENNTSNNTKNNTNNIIHTQIFDHWNSKKITVHRKLVDNTKRKIKSTLKDYTQEEIIKAIDNYHYVLRDQNSFFNYEWTLAEFLQRGLEKFLKDNARENHKIDSSRQPQAPPIQKKIVNVPALKEELKETVELLDQHMKEMTDHYGEGWGVDDLTPQWKGELLDLEAKMDMLVKEIKEAE